MDPLPVQNEEIEAVLPENADLFYHSFNVTGKCTALRIEIIPESSDHQLMVLLRKDKFPYVNTSSPYYGMDFVRHSPVSMDPAGEDQNI